MTTMIFVHGTGVRKAGYDKNYDLIAPYIREIGCEPARCLWGDEHGSKFIGAALPGYESEEMRGEIALWQMLLQSPFSELMLLEDRGDEADLANHGHFVWEQLLTRVPGEGTKGELHRLFLDRYWQAAYDELTQEPSQRWETLVKDTANNDGTYETALSRCLIALVCRSAQEDGVPALSRQDREGLLRLLVTDFGGSARGPGGLVMKFVAGLFTPLATPVLRWTRETWSNGASPAAGDVLMYQARGTAIRSFIHERIAEQTEPVILLAHSLGGIACVDLLLLNHLPQVKALITVGSQAPYLYEINALNGLENGAAWPSTFPTKWLNIFDRSDFLSYPGEGVLPDKVRDFEVHSHQPFPESHSAYWRTPELWTELGRFLKEIRA